jgi:hypothetical protein
VVCLINNDVEALHPEWLVEMVSVALQPGVGAGRAKLLYPTGASSTAASWWGSTAPPTTPMPARPEMLPATRSSSSCVARSRRSPAACLVVRPRALPRGGRPRRGGLSGLLQRRRLLSSSSGHADTATCGPPHARLVHHESASRGKALRPQERARADRELAVLRSRWADALLDDPYHSPNLSLSSNVPRLAWPPRERRPWSL